MKSGSWSSYQAALPQEARMSGERDDDDGYKVERAGGGELPENHTQIDPTTGQQKAYVVLSKEDRAKGFVRPVRRAYVHVGIDQIYEKGVVVKRGANGCGTRTVMALDIAEAYARNPKFYSVTFCCKCKTHRPLEEFIWEDGGEMVGS